MDNICNKCEQKYDDYYIEEVLESENNYCVLHCDKSNWKNLKGKEFKARYDSFWDEIREIVQKVNNRNDLIKEHGESNDILESYLFKDIHFSFFNFKKLGNTYYTNYTPDGEENGIYSIFNGLEANIDIIFDNCIFEEEVDLTSIKLFNNVLFKENCNIKNGINFSNNSFSHNITISTRDIIDINCEKSVFKKYVDLSSLSIVDLLLKNTTFDENLNLLGSKVKEPFDLTNTIIKNNINLLNFECDVANRQTARIIKNEFDNQGDIINANIFYAKEMALRETELSWSKNFVEKLVFSVHKISSNYSQDWFLVILWILNVSFLYLFTLKYTVYYIDTAIFYTFFLLVFGIFYNFFNRLVPSMYLGKILLISSLFIFPIMNLNEFANLINPFSIMTGNEKLTINLLILKITISYLLYQLIISIRQNTRRQ